MRLIFLLPMIFYFQASLSQQTYVVNDSSVQAGVSIIEGTPMGNAQSILVKSNGKMTKYSPSDITEYGLDDGRIFKAFEIRSDGNVKRYFLERLFNGRFNVYYLVDQKRKKRFFIEANKEAALVEVPQSRAKYVELLTTFIKDCPAAEHNLGNVTLKKNLLARYLSDYRTCSNSSLPRFRISVQGGIDINRFIASSRSDEIVSAKFNANVGFHIGGFVDSPLGQSNYSINTGLVLHHYQSSTTFSIENFPFDLVVDQLRLEAPILFRYTFYNLKSCPFIEAGAIYSGRLMGESNLYNYTSANGAVYINYDESTGNHHQVGFRVGGGFILKYDSKHSLLAKLGYGNLYPIHPKTNSVIVNDIVLSLGVLL